MTAAVAVRSEPTGFGGPEDYRRLFWRALRVVHLVTENKRQAFCRRVVRGELVTVEKRAVARGSDRASFGGLYHCGLNGCPLCGPKIAAERAVDIALAISSHYHAEGRVAFANWTMRHDRSQALAELLGGLGRAYRAAGYNKTPRRLLEAHSVGQIRKLETTHGAKGWHPHSHELIFLTSATTDDQAHELSESRFSAWSASLERQGFGKANLKGHEFRILDLDQAQEKIAEYVAKSAGHELAAAGTKRGRGQNRTPLEILVDLGELGQEADRRLWLEHERAMKGKRVLRWSPGLRRRLLSQQLPELSDQEAADSTDGLARIIAAVGVDTWRRVWRSPGGPTVLLSAVELYDDDDDARDSLARYLARHGLGQLEAVTSKPPGTTACRGPQRA